LTVQGIIAMVLAAVTYGTAEQINVLQGHGFSRITKSEKA
jgi:hypothetical protein